MSKHRNPRPRVPRQPTPDNPPCRRRRHPQVMLAAFGHLVRENPRRAAAVLAVLEIVAEAGRSRAIHLVEAVSAVVVASPERAP